VKILSLRAQMWAITLGYVAVTAVSAFLLYQRHLYELNHAADVSAASGMWAGGDALLDIFIACLLMIPTFFLVWVMARFETLFTVYSQILLILSVTAPVCLILLDFGGKRMPQSLSVIFLYRTLCSPFALFGIGVSRLVARFDQAKKLISYAFLIEGLTLCIAVVLFFGKS
jgi:hypothetical protein